MNQVYDVIIIGAGPSGLAAARSLLKKGVTHILLVEREKEAGGVPRHCRHPTFGIQTFLRPMNGHVWANKILSKVAGSCEIRTSTTVTSIKAGGEIEISSDNGIETLKAKRVIIATGVRETPRHPRLVSGLRPQGVLTAGALQQFIYLRKLKPGIRPVIVGSELVSFSAIWTLRNAGIKALALIDEHSRPLAFRPSVLYAKLLGVDVYLGSHITSINGKDRVESVEFRDADGKSNQIACDSIIFTGRFTGEYTLIRNSHLAFEPESGRPLFDQFGQCSDPAFFVVGNMTHPADMGDQCYQEGLRVGLNVADSLAASTAKSFSVPVVHDDLFKITAPNMISLSKPANKTTLNVRVTRYFKGEIIVKHGNDIIYKGKHRCLPERRILLKDIDISGITNKDEIIVTTR
ncbi:FAD-dependent oxidoreductase [Atlantibacter subterranea]|uniref:NAD(P)/FAD-dependent oxidoreductase n=1 Tax=Atlantibacter subterraneus TaxID=255519 RepID=UPI001181CFE7|nr:FAD-dependent oxidoreductase [Atlantibacter subterranea]TSJ50836.1 FAD-dependent oxidoreductase [Atlantibacter subterranea]